LELKNRELQTSNQMQTDSLSPSPNPVSPVPLNNPTSAPRYGTVVPNRIFVGGIDLKTNENDLRKFFSQYGSVKEVKIVNDRAGVPKGLVSLWIVHGIDSCIFIGLLGFVY
uniref:RRM domain-containing protein n=1 Tax=Monodon monoceros TaxID=40151 RepID=A0A8C6AHN7_MONMO